MYPIMVWTMASSITTTAGQTGPNSPKRRLDEDGRHLQEDVIVAIEQKLQNGGEVQMVLGPCAMPVDCTMPNLPES